MCYFFSLWEKSTEEICARLQMLACEVLKTYICLSTENKCMQLLKNISVCTIWLQFHKDFSLSFYSPSKKPSLSFQIMMKCLLFARKVQVLDFYFWSLKKILNFNFILGGKVFMQQLFLQSLLHPKDHKKHRYCCGVKCFNGERGGEWSAFPS